MTIVTSTPSSTKKPGTYIDVILGGPGTSAGLAPTKQLHLGNAILSAITATVNTTGGGGTEVYTTAAGTATVAQPVPVFSAADAAGKFGYGSELHLMAKVAFAADQKATIYACPVADAGGTRATGVITPTLGTLAACTLRIVVCGRVMDIPLTATDTVSTIGLAMARAINRNPDLPVTAQNVWATGATTLTAKCTGPRGNTISFRAYIITSTQTAKANAGALGATLAGLTITLSGGTALDTDKLYVLSGGATQDNFTTALANVASTRYHRYVCACIDGTSASTNAGRVAAQMDTLAAGNNAQFGQRAVFGSVDSYANVVTFATGLNRSRCHVVWSRYSDDLPCEIAAAACAAEIAGDAAAGGTTVGTGGYVAANLNGLELVGLRAQDVVGAQHLDTELESCLNNGISPLALSSARPGYMQLVAAITTRSLDAASLPNYAVYKTLDVDVPDYLRDYLRSDFATTYKGTKLVPNTSDGAPPKFNKFVTPSIISGRIIYDLKILEDQGILSSVNAHVGEVAVEIDATNNRRVNCEIPCPVPPDFDIAAGNVRQIAP